MNTPILYIDESQTIDQTHAAIVKEIRTDREHQDQQSAFAARLDDLADQIGALTEHLGTLTAMVVNAVLDIDVARTAGKPGAASSALETAITLAYQVRALRGQLARTANTLVSVQHGGLG